MDILFRVPVFVPAMNSHLLDSTSKDSIIRQSSLHKLELFMIVLKEIQDIYSSATFIHGLFSQAIDKLKSPQYTNHLDRVSSGGARQSSRQHSGVADSHDLQGSEIIRGGDPLGNDFAVNDYWDINDGTWEFWSTPSALSATGVEMVTDPF